MLHLMYFHAYVEMCQKQVSDSISIFDSLTTSAAKTQPLSDNLSLSDSEATSSTKTKSLSDFVSITGSVGISSNKIISLSDSVSSSDAKTTSAIKIQSHSDSISISDLLTTSASKIQSLIESETITGVASAQKSTSMSFDETMNLSEGTSVSASKQVNSLDTLGTADTISLLKIGSNQYLVPNNQTTVNVDPSKPNLIVTSSNAALSSITVPFTATSSTLSYAPIISSGTVHILHALNITKDTNGDGNIEVVLTIPAVTDISNPAWDGILQLPTTQTSSSLVLPAPQGQVATAKTVIGLGSSLQLTFNNATRISFIGENGTHVGFYYTPTSVTEITQTCSGDNQSAANALPAGGICKMDVGHNVVVWTKHFTGFVTWTLGQIPPTPSSPQIPPVSGGGYGTGAVTATPTGITSAASMLPAGVTLYDVTYDICDQQKVQFTVGSTDSTTPTVEFATPSGVVTAKISDHQPYAGLYDLTKQYVLSYDAPLKPGVKTFNMLITPETGTGYVTAKVDVTKCKQTVTFAPIPIIGENGPDAPRVFDIKLQMDNDTKTSAEETGNQYIANQTTTISGLVYSLVPLDHAEIRVAKIGDNTTTGYVSVLAKVVPISVSHTYLVSATLPSDYLVSPAITYWVYAKNIEGFEINSDQYSVGVAPSYDASGTIGFVIPQNVPAGLTQSPQVYLTNNAQGILYGTISLVVDGKQVSQFVDHVFDRGTSVMELDWNVPNTNGTAVHSVQAVASFYGHTFTSDTAQVNSYVYKKIMPLTNMEQLESFVDSQGNVISNPRSLYSSFVTGNGTLFHVVSPGGTCVIGDSSECLVNESTLTTNDRYSVVTIDGVSYTVYYSDVHSPLQRFTITSLQPITGDWKITLEKNGIEQKDLESKVHVNVKYVAEDKQLLISLP